MALLLNWRVWFVIGSIAALCTAGYRGYKAGEAHVQGQFDAYKLQAQADYTKALAEANAKTQGFQTSLENLTDAYIKNQQNHAVAINAASGKLRDFQSALSHTDTCSATAPSSADGSTQPINQLFGDCAAALVELAKEADGLEEQVVGLQAYANAAHKFFGEKSK